MSDPGRISEELRRLIDDIAPTEVRRQQAQQLRRDLLAATPSPTPPEGLREALAEVGRWIDGLDSVSVEWAPAHTAPYVSKLVLRPGIEAIFARRLAASPAPDPGAGLRDAAQAVVDSVHGVQYGTSTPRLPVTAESPVHWQVSGAAIDALRVALTPSAGPPETP